MVKKGYRTIVYNVLMLVATMAGLYGVDFPPEMVEEVTAGVVSIITAVNLVLRAVTTGPVGEST